MQGAFGALQLLVEDLSVDSQLSFLIPKVVTTCMIMILKWWDPHNH